MSLPRQILPGVTYAISRRTAQRQMLLRPSRTTNRIVQYVLAVAAKRYGVAVHAAVAMSDHIHLVVTDPGARLPEFMSFFLALVARALNASLGRWESLWDPRPYSAVRLATPDDVVAKVAYALANPVSAGLVRTGRVWPGVWSDPDAIGGPAIEVRRPERFFAEDGALPETAELSFTVPPGFSSAAEFRERVVRTVEECEKEEVAKRGARGFLGVAKVLATKPTARARSREERRGLSPRVAARDRWIRIEAVAELKRFRADHRDALEAYRAKDKNVVFPAGTYLMRVAHGVRCAPAVAFG